MEIKRINPSQETSHISKQRRDDPHHKRKQQGVKTQPTFKQVLEKATKEADDNER